MVRGLDEERPHSNALIFEELLPDYLVQGHGSM
jgi:hypothetical protein